MKKFYSMMMVMLMFAVAASAGPLGKMQKVELSANPQISSTVGDLKSSLKVKNLDSKQAKTLSLKGTKAFKRHSAKGNVMVKKSNAQSVNAGQATSIEKKATSLQAKKGPRKAASVADLLGDYEWQFYDYFEKGNYYITFSMVAGEADNEVVILSETFDNVPLKAYVDPANGTLSIPSGQFFMYSEQTKVNYLFYFLDATSEALPVLDAMVGEITDYGVSFSADVWMSIGQEGNPLQAIACWLNNVFVKEGQEVPTDPVDLEAIQAICGQYVWTYLDSEGNEVEDVANLEIFNETTGSILVSNSDNSFMTLAQYLPDYGAIGLQAQVIVGTNADGEDVYSMVYDMSGDEPAATNFLIGALNENGGFDFTPTDAIVLQDNAGSLYFFAMRNAWSKGGSQTPEPGEPEEDPQPVPAEMLGNYDWSYRSGLQNVDDGTFEITLSQSPLAINAVEITGFLGECKMIGYVNAEKRTLTIKANQVIGYASNYETDINLVLEDAEADWAPLSEVVGTINEDGSIVFSPYHAIEFAITSEGKVLYYNVCYANVWSPVRPDTTEWQDLGDASFVDGYYLPIYGNDPFETPHTVLLQQDKANANRYRIVNPYAGSVYNSVNIDPTKEGAIVFDVTDPECVVIEAGVYSGLEAPLGYGATDYGKFYCTNLVGYFVKNGYSVDVVKEALSQPDENGEVVEFSTFKDGVLDIKDACFGYNSSKVGSYTWTDTDMTGQIVFPGANGIEDLVKEDVNAPVEYFNLQGQRVANPESGLYIRRQGAKASKVFVK